MVKEFAGWLICKYYKILSSNRENFLEFLKQNVSDEKDQRTLEEIFELNEKIYIAGDLSRKKQMIAKLKERFGIEFPLPSEDLNYDVLKTMLLSLFEHKYQHKKISNEELITYTVITDYLSGFERLLDIEKRNPPEIRNEFWKRLAQLKINRVPLLHYMIRKSASPYVELILEGLTNLEFFDADNESVLHAAVRAGNHKLVCALLQSTLAVPILNHKNSDDKTAIGVALEEIDILHLEEEDWDMIAALKDSLDYGEIETGKEEESAELNPKVKKYENFISIIENLLAKVKPTSKEIEFIKNLVDEKFIDPDEDMKEAISHYEGEKRYTFGTRAGAFAGLLVGFGGLFIATTYDFVAGTVITGTSTGLGILAFAASRYMPYESALQRYKFLKDKLMGGLSRQEEEPMETMNFEKLEEYSFGNNEILSSLKSSSESVHVTTPTYSESKRKESKLEEEEKTTDEHLITMEDESPQTASESSISYIP